MVWTIQELDDSEMPRHRPVTFKSRRQPKRWAIIGGSIVVCLLLVAALLCIIMYYALPPIEICVMECPDSRTPDPQCRTCMPKCPDSKHARWGKVKDAQTLVPLSRVTLKTDVTGQEVASSVNGDFGVCVDNETVSFHMDSYIPKQITLQSRHVNVLLQKIVPLQFTVQPIGKVAQTGDTMTLCCNATGSPAPSRIEWYKDGVLISSGSNVSIETASRADAGLYWCQASTHYAALSSSIAEVFIIENETETCQPAPLPKLQKLQNGCYVMKNGSEQTAIDTGQCSKDQCVSPSTGGATCSTHYYAQGEGRCCEPIRVEMVIELLYCRLESPRNVTYRVVRECGCRTCSHNVVTVSGYVTSHLSLNTPLNFVDVVRNKRVVAISNARGYYLFSLSYHILADPRVVLTFNDPSGQHLSLTKTVQITRPGHYTLDIQLPKTDQVLWFNATEGGEFFVGVHPSRSIATVALTPQSFYDHKGYQYDDIVEVLVKWIEPSEDTNPPFLPSDLMAVDPSGNISGLSSFGMFAIQLRSASGEVLSTSDGIQVFVDASVVGEGDNYESTSKLWTLNPDTGYWEYASDLLQKSTGGRSKRQTQTIFVGRVRISADRLWINIDKPFPMCLVKVRAFGSEQFEAHEQISEVKVTVVAMNPPRTGDDEEWRWGRISDAITHDQQGACVPTICDIANGTNWGYVKASRAGQPLFPADPQKGATGVNKVKEVLEYETVGDSIKTKLVNINGPPFYFYAQYLLCYRQYFKDPHFRFYLPSQEKCEFEHTAVSEPQVHLSSGPVDFNYLAWYPRANPEHFYEVCYMKIAVGASFVEKGPGWSQYDEVKRAVVYGGGPTVLVLDSLVGNVHGNVSIQPGDPFGSRSQCVDQNKTVCIEYKKSGVAVDGTTVMETELRGYVELSRCGVAFSEAIMEDFPSVSRDRRIPITMVGSKYGVYCEKGPLLADVKTDALRHCYAGSDTETSRSMRPGTGIGMVFCPDYCASNPCHNNGKCRQWENGYNCTCPVGYRGRRCECKDGEPC